MTITVKINGTEQEIELSDEQIIAIGSRYFELTCPSKSYFQPIDTAFGVMEQPDEMSLAFMGEIRTDK